MTKHPISRAVDEPGASITRAEEGELASYRVAVDYQTSSGGGTRYVTVDARSWYEAQGLASDMVRSRRGVLKVNGGSGIGHPLRMAT